MRINAEGTYFYTHLGGKLIPSTIPNDHYISLIKTHDIDPVARDDSEVCGEGNRRKTEALFVSADSEELDMGGSKYVFES